MTDDDRASGESLDAELARRADAEGRIAAALADLEHHPGLQLMSTVTPTGGTGERWTATRRSLAELWRDFETYKRVVAAARAVRTRRSKPGGRELAELRHLLVEPSIEVARTAVPLPKRGLFNEAEHVETITLDHLTTRMDTTFVQVSELVMTCHAVHQAFLTGLAPLAERLQTARQLAEELTTGRAGPPDPTTATVAALTTRITELEHISATDPLALAAEPPTEVLAALDTEVTAVTKQLEELATLRTSWDDQLAELSTTIQKIARLRDDAEQTRQRAQDLINSSGPIMPPNRLPNLRTGLAALSRPAGWPARAEALAALHRAADAATAELRTARDLATGLLDRRDELRGRFAAYRAKATRLGHTEHPQLLALDQRIKALLWTKPCDLATATRALTAYQRLLTTGPDTTDTPGRST
jgi:hypothetical protein